MGKKTAKKKTASSKANPLGPGPSGLSSPAINASDVESDEVDTPAQEVSPGSSSSTASNTLSSSPAVDKALLSKASSTVSFGPTQEPLTLLEKRLSMIAGSDSDDDDKAFERYEYVPYEEIENAYNNILTQTDVLLQSVSKGREALLTQAKQLAMDVATLSNFVPKLNMFDAKVVSNTASSLTVFEAQTPTGESLPNLVVFTPEKNSQPPGQQSISDMIDQAGISLRESIKDVVQGARRLAKQEGHSSAASTPLTETFEPKDTLRDDVAESVYKLVQSTKSLFDAMKQSTGVVRAAEDDALAANIVPEETLSKKTIGKHKRLHSKSGADVKVISLVSKQTEEQHQNGSTSPSPKEKPSLTPISTLSPNVIGISLDAALGDLERISGENESLRQQLDQALQLHHQVQIALVQQTETSKGLQVELAAALADKGTLEDKVSRAQQQADEKVKSILAEHGRQELEREKQQAVVASEKKELDQLRESNKELLETVSDLRAKVAASAAMQRALASKSSTSAADEKDKSKLENEIEMLRAANKRLEISRHEMIQKLGQSEEWEKLESVIGKDLQKFFTTHSPATSLSGILVFIADRIKQIGEVSSKLSGHNPLAKADLDTLLYYFKHLQEQVAPYSAQIKNVEQTYVKTADALAVAERTISKLHGRIQVYEKRIQVLDQQVDDMNEDLEKQVLANLQLKEEKTATELQVLETRRDALLLQNALHVARAKLAKEDEDASNDVKAEVGAEELAELLPETKDLVDLVAVSAAVPTLTASDSKDQLLPLPTTSGDDDAVAAISIHSDDSSIDIPSPLGSPVSVSSLRRRKTVTVPAIVPKNRDEAAVVLQKYRRGQLGRRQVKKIIARQHIAREILETETSYVRHITVLHDVYMQNLKKKIGSIITQQQFDTLFFHVPEILAFNKGLEEKIRASVEKWYHERLLGKIFVDASGPLEVYTFFVNNYNKALAVFHELRNNSAFKAYTVELKAQQGRRALELNDLLIMPVQRTPRYLLLLQTLVGKTRPDHPDYNNLLAAIESLKHTVEVIDTKKGEAERYQKVIELQGKITGLPSKYEPLSKGDERYWIKDGDLFEHGGNGNPGKERRLILFNDVIMCCKPVTTKGRWGLNDNATVGYELKWLQPMASFHHISTNYVDLPKEGGGGQYALTLTFYTPDGKLKEKRVLSLVTETDRTSWASELEKAIKTWQEVEGSNDSLPDSSANSSRGSLEAQASTASLTPSVSSSASRSLEARPSVASLNKQDRLDPTGQRKPAALFGAEARMRSAANRKSMDLTPLFRDLPITPATAAGPASALPTGASINTIVDKEFLQKAIDDSKATVAQLRKDISLDTKMLEALGKIMAETANKIVKTKIQGDIDDGKKKLALAHKQLVAEDYNLLELQKKIRALQTEPSPLPPPSPLTLATENNAQ